MVYNKLRVCLPVSIFDSRRMCGVKKFPVSLFWAEEVTDGRACILVAISGMLRTQRVRVNGGLSDVFPVKQGVPQGSCLRPLLFTIYTSKLFEIVSWYLPSIHCYAVVSGIQPKHASC